MNYKKIVISLMLVSVVSLVEASQGLQGILKKSSSDVSATSDGNGSPVSVAKSWDKNAKPEKSCLQSQQGDSKARRREFLATRAKIIDNLSGISSVGKCVDPRGRHKAATVFSGAAVERSEKAAENARLKAACVYATIDYRHVSLARLEKNIVHNHRITRFNQNLIK